MLRPIFAVVMLGVLVGVQSQAQTKPFPGNAKSVSPETGTFTDPRDNKIYKTVVIGNQTWLAENLAYKPSSGSWVLDNDENNVEKLGRLYSFEAAKSVCPAGWHLPSDGEWLELTECLGGATSAGGKLKAKTGWEGPNRDATNETGFGALPASYRRKDGGFGSAAGYRDAIFWTSTPCGGLRPEGLPKVNNKYLEGESWQALGRELTTNDGKITRSVLFLDCAFSVRCVKDK